MRATYAELTARIPNAKAELIRQWASRYAGAPETYTKKYEIDVAFSEHGNDYWLTFSRKTLDSFWKADVLNKPVDLFLNFVSGQNNVRGKLNEFATSTLPKSTVA